MSNQLRIKSRSNYSDLIEFTKKIWHKVILHWIILAVLCKICQLKTFVILSMFYNILAHVILFYYVIILVFILF